MLSRLKHALNAFWAKLRLLLLGLSLLLVIGIAGGVWLWSDYQGFVNKPLELPAEGAVYELKTGTTLAALHRQWSERGWLAQDSIGGGWAGGWVQTRYLQLMARQSGLATRLKAGEYRLPAGSQLIDALTILASGKVVQHKLTIIEGWTFTEMMAVIRANEVLQKTLDDATDEDIMKAIGRGDTHPEGYFLPDTYAFPRGTTDVQFLRRANRALEATLDKAWQGREEGLPYSESYEALIMASIVEKETAAVAERPIIAGVFVRRLKLGMRLQTDPTVIYGMGDAYAGNLRRKDLRTDTPYNSYTRKGLPPTPIALASVAAIRAALHPATGRSLYFVAKGNGEHQFSATLEQHNKAVRRYQIRRRSKNYRSTPVPTVNKKPQESQPLRKASDE